ncbi:hypothetical protein EHS17_04870 [Rhodobacteraceae bacterium CH30]|nr:hypothetical protein EHS17_04870 [Rhodobacteraceae bacterium CH30]
MDDKMKKLAIIAALLTSSAAWAAAPAPAAPGGLSADYMITCSEANEEAKTDAGFVSALVASMGNASVEARNLKITPSKDLDAKVVKAMGAICKKDPDGLLLNAVDSAMRSVASK